MDNKFDIEILSKIKNYDHILVSIPPKKGVDIVIKNFQKILGETGINWITYLSATSVYGDHQGKWVDEKSKLNPSTDNGANRPFVLENFYKKLDEITSYVFFDYRDLLVNGGEVKLYEIPVEDVTKLWEDGKLGTRTSISVKPRKTFLPEISSMFDDLFPYEKYRFELGEKK